MAQAPPESASGRAQSRRSSTRHIASAATALAVALVIAALIHLLSGPDGSRGEQRGADAEVVAADAQHVADALRTYRQDTGTYPRRLTDPAISDLVHDPTGPTQADPDTTLVWSWTNKARTRIRFCIGYRRTHAHYDSKTDTVTSDTKPRCPTAPVGTYVYNLGRWH